MRLLVVMSLITVSVISFSQDCESYIKHETDRFTGKASWSSEPMVLSESPDSTFAVICVGVSGHKALALTLIATNKSNSCYDESSVSLILLRNGEKIELSNNAGFNCKGSFTVYFGEVYGKRRQLKSLMNSPIEAIRIRGLNGYFEYDLPIEEAEKIMNTLKCMAGKTVKF